MISQINITVNAAKPKFPLSPMVAFNGSPSSVRISGVPCSIGNWSINNVRVLVSYPNNFTVEKQAVKVDNLWIATIDGSQVNGVIKNGFQVIADGVDENNLPVNGYVLGVGDVVVLERDKGIEKLVQKYAVRYLNEPPTNPSIGDLLNLNGNVRIWDGSKWVSVSGEDVAVYDSTITIQANGVEIDSFTVNASEAKTIDIPVPSKVSELNNDIGYITASQVPPVPSKVSELDNDAGYITMSAIPAIPSKTSELDNDSGFITASALPTKVSELQNDTGFITLSEVPPNPSKVSELDNDAGYITASAIPPIPSKTSDLTNDSGFITAQAIPSNISSFNNDVGYLSAVTWNDVSGKPNIPSNTSDLVNDSGFITASAIPSNVGAFTNDVDYITASQVEPETGSGYEGYAKNALYAERMYNKIGLGSVVDKNSDLRYADGRLKIHSTKYYPWSLSYYNGTTFDPPYELVFDYKKYVSFFDGRRLNTININSYCWIYNPNNTTLYFIPCSSNGVPTGTMGIGKTSYPITLSQDGLSIETINGQSGNITCTRTSTGTTTTSRYVAFEDQVPSAISQLTNDSGYVTASTVAASYYNKNEIDGMIGSINTILDNINGEVI